jgi:hypothetical protein
MLKKAIFETEHGTLEFESVEHCTVNGENFMFRFWYESFSGYTTYYMKVVSSNSTKQYGTAQIEAIERLALIRNEIKSLKRPI